MTKYLISQDNPSGSKLEEVLKDLRKDILLRCTKIVDDHRPEAYHVLDNNMNILSLLTEAIHIAEDSTMTLDKAFGPSSSSAGGPPRIGSE